MMSYYQLGLQEQTSMTYSGLVMWSFDLSIVISLDMLLNKYLIWRWLETHRRSWDITVVFIQSGRVTAAHHRFHPNKAFSSITTVYRMRHEMICLCLLHLLGKNGWLDSNQPNKKKSKTNWCLVTHMHRFMKYNVAYLASAIISTNYNLSVDQKVWSIKMHSLDKTYLKISSTEVGNSTWPQCVKTKDATHSASCFRQISSTLFRAINQVRCHLWNQIYNISRKRRWQKPFDFRYTYDQSRTYPNINLFDNSWANQLTHWGRVTHICVGKLIIIGSDNGLSPDRRQIIIWTNAGLLSIGPLRTYFSESSIKIQQFSLKKMHVKMSSAKWRPSCLSLNVLIKGLRPVLEGFVVPMHEGACETGSQIPRA